MSDEPLIRCEGLVKIYKVAHLEVFALQGLDLQVQRGELLGIVGASGSGKSTLMNILGGLDRPSAGRVWVNGTDLLKLNERALNRYRSTQVGFVWQQGARNLIPYLSVLENVRLPITIAGSDQGNTDHWAEELLDRVGLSDRSHHRLAELSGGEQQRAAIAVSLANRPSLLLADEPTGEVDTQTAQTIFQTFRDLSKQHGITTLIVSHDAGIARQVDRVVAIRDGKTSTETIRTPFSGTGTVEQPEEAVYEEVSLLDAAGRLQMPAAYLEKFAIQGRVYLEVTPEGILVRPAPAYGAPSAARVEKPEDRTLPQAAGQHSWVRKLFKKRQP